MPETVPDVLLADKPLEHPKDDCLGYASFAEQLAQLVRRMPPEGLVVAIRGDWGMGKSTVLNFVEHNLSESTDGNPPIVVRFNPWWFTGRENIVGQFLLQLRRALSRLRVKAEEIVGFMSDLTDALRPVVGSHVSAAAETAKVLCPEQTDVHKLKARIARELAKGKQRIVFFLDDIDRLTAEEIRDLFMAIRAIADFPNVCYFLAFDWRVVVNALNGMQGEDGEDYLEKIVQLSTAVPPPAKTALHGFSNSKLTSIFKDTRPELKDKDTDTRGAILKGYVADFIDTPRDAVRLANSVAAFYEEVKDEAIVSDYLAANALNVFCPLAYDMVAHNPEKFEVAVTIEGNLKADLIKFHSRWLESIRERDKERLIRLLGAMYPQLQSVFEAIEHGKS